MAAVDGWVSDVDDVLSKAEHSYRQITEDTTTDEKRMLLADAKRLVRIMDAGLICIDEWSKGQSRCPFNPNQEIASRTTD